MNSIHCCAWAVLKNRLKRNFLNPALSEFTENRILFSSPIIFSSSRPEIAHTQEGLVRKRWKQYSKREKMKE